MLWDPRSNMRDEFAMMQQWQDIQQNMKELHHF
jgi:hypothetical protein